MSQADLFVFDQAFELNLPALNYGPVQLAVGQVRRIVRLAEKVEAKAEGEVFVSARIKEPLYSLPSGEKVVVTTRKIASRPREADGVLFREADGTLRWLYHRALEVIDQRAADAGWKVVLDELASEWNGRFLFQAERPEADGSVRPGNEGLSTLFYEAPNFKPRNFHVGLPENMIPHAVWLNETSNTLFFVTRTEPFLKWTRSRSVRDRTWDLFILHYDDARKLLYLSSSDHDSTFETLAKAVGATKLIFGDVMFRSLGRISRLLFQNVGVKKHGRRNLPAR